MDNEIITVKDASTMLKMSQQYVRSLIRDKKINAEMFGKQWMIYKSDLLEYIKQNRIVIEPEDHPRLTDEIPDIIALSFFLEQWG